MKYLSFFLSSPPFICFPLFLHQSLLFLYPSLCCLLIFPNLCILKQLQPFLFCYLNRNQQLLLRHFYFYITMQHDMYNRRWLQSTCNYDYIQNTSTLIIWKNNTIFSNKVDHVHLCMYPTNTENDGLIYYIILQRIFMLIAWVFLTFYYVCHKQDVTKW